MTFKRRPLEQNEMMKSYYFSFYKKYDRPLHQKKFRKSYPCLISILWKTKITLENHIRVINSIKDQISLENHIRVSDSIKDHDRHLFSCIDLSTGWIILQPWKWSWKWSWKLLILEQKNKILFIKPQLWAGRSSLNRKGNWNFKLWFDQYQALDRPHLKITFF